MIAVSVNENIEKFTKALKELKSSLEDTSNIDYQCLANTESFLQCAKRLQELLDFIERVVGRGFADISRSAIKLLENASSEEKEKFTALLENYKSFIEAHRESSKLEWQIVLEGLEIYKNIKWIEEFRDKIIKLGFLYFTEYMAGVQFNRTSDPQRVADYRKLGALNKFNAYMEALGLLARLDRGFLNNIVMVSEGNVNPLDYNSLNLWWTIKDPHECPPTPPYDSLPVINDIEMIRRLYAEIYEWYKEYKNLPLILYDNSANNLYAFVSREFIEKLPSPDKASIHDIYSVAKEVLSGILEWGFQGLSKKTRTPLGIIAAIIEKSLKDKADPRKSILYNEGIAKIYKLMKELGREKEELKKNPPPACGRLLDFVERKLMRA